MNLKNALKALNEAVSDLTSLHVQTFTGQVELTISAESNFNTLKDQLDKAKKDGKVALVAESLIKFDGDSYNFVMDNADDKPNSAFEVHQNAVRSGLETRQALLALFKGLFD